ncbi:MAG TPA: hypothetical protein DDW89_02000, partial [Gammaproteobacteria bacterium]|nr:hypothetical protein [Gammaproteobacteria bacterium]
MSAADAEQRHQDRMARKKAVVDAGIARADRDQGLLLVLTVGTALVLSWAPDRSVEELSARWAPPPSEFVRIGGMRVHLRDEGPRKGTTPIVLLHG